MNYDNKNYLIFSPHSKIYLAENHKITFCFCSRHAENKKLRNEFSILVLIFFWGGGGFISPFFFSVNVCFIPQISCGGSCCPTPAPSSPGRAGTRVLLGCPEVYWEWRETLLLSTSVKVIQVSARHDGQWAR